MDKYPVQGSVEQANGARKLPRNRVLKAGKIVFSNFQCSIDVMVRDISVNGARVHVPANVAIPDSFELFVVSQDCYYPATTRWRAGEWIGVEFVGPPHHAVATPIRIDLGGIPVIQKRSRKPAAVLR